MVAQHVIEVQGRTDVSESLIRAFDVKHFERLYALFEGGKFEISGSLRVTPANSSNNCDAWRYARR